MSVVQSVASVNAWGVTRLLHSSLHIPTYKPGLFDFGVGLFRTPREATYKKQNSWSGMKTKE